MKTSSSRRPAARRAATIVGALGLLAGVFLLGRASVGARHLLRRRPRARRGARRARRRGGRGPASGSRRAARPHPPPRPGGGEEAKLHRTPEFLERYSEELARVYLEKAFDEPFQKKLPTEAEVRKFFDEHQAKLGRPVLPRWKPGTSAQR